MFPGKDITDGWYQQLEITIWVLDAAMWRKKDTGVSFLHFCQEYASVHKSTEQGVLQQAVGRFILQSWIDLKK